MKRVTNYNNSRAINASLLKRVHNPKWIRYYLDHPDTDPDAKRHLRIGQALDTLLTSDEEFYNEFYIVDKVRPGGLMGKFIDALPRGLNEESSPDEYLEAYEQAGWKIGVHQAIKNLWNTPKYKDYYIARGYAGDKKKIISSDELEDLEHARKALLFSPFTKYFFIPSPGKELFFQVPIYFRYQDMDCKALLDGIVLDQDNRKIIPFDLKTIGKNIHQFSRDYIKYGYHIQAGHYVNAVKALLQNEAFVDHPDFPTMEGDWELDPFLFIVTEAKSKLSNPARIFQVSEQDLSCAVTGGTLTSGTFIEGIDARFRALKWHFDTGHWEYPMDLYQNNGIAMLNSFVKSDG